MVIMVINYALDTRHQQDLSPQPIKKVDFGPVANLIGYSLVLTIPKNIASFGK